jgi:1-acyl-sn-glycerol-3-phosphate acyltransferase
MSPVFRALLSSLVLVLATVVGAIASLISRLFDSSGETVIKLARIWSQAILTGAGIKVSTMTRGTLDPGRPYVFMANHVSAVDIFALYVSLPVRVRMIAKKQLGAIPLFGWAMRAGRFIFIDRQNPVAARRSIDEAARRIRGGHSVLIFPEGTRSADGKLAPFKKGGFHLAISSGASIVPVAIRGAHEAMRKGSMLLYAHPVSVEIGEPIPTANLTNADREALHRKVRSTIYEMLEEPDGKPEQQPAGEGAAIAAATVSKEPEPG